MGHTQAQLRLAQAFILCAFMNFLVGASLGGWMANDPSVIPRVAAVHAEVNPFGWLTMMIYGMTYAVLILSAGLRIPRMAGGWLHFGLAELGVVTIVVGVSARADLLVAMGTVIQALTPICFMVNILSAMAAKRRFRGGSAEPVGPNGTTSSASDVGEPSVIPRGVLQWFGRSAVHRPTDRIAQRGTDMALLAWVAAGMWSVVDLWHRGIPWTGWSSGVELLAYYGWIAGTVLSVALHLFPRFAGTVQVPGRWAVVSQVLWGLGVLALVVGAAKRTSSWLDAGARLTGAAILLAALMFARVPADPEATLPVIRLEGAALWAWWWGWLYAGILGASLLLGLAPLSAMALHLLFLGWITSLVYAVGYSLFPAMFRRRPRWPSLNFVQVLGAELGASMLILGLALFPSGTKQGLTLMAVGGTVSAVCAVWFLLQWLVALPTAGPWHSAHVRTRR